MSRTLRKQTIWESSVELQQTLHSSTKEGRDFNEVIKEITSIVDGPISGEVKATTVDAEGMIKEGREIAAIHPTW